MPTFTPPFSDSNNTKLGHISVTQAVDLDAMETDISQHQTLFGVSDGNTHLGTFTQRDATYPTVASNQTVKQVLQDVITSIEQIGGIDARKYGCDPTGANDSAPGLELAVQAANLYAVTIGTIHRPADSGTSISRKGMPKIILPCGEYKFDTPCELKYTDANHVWIEGWGAVIYQGASFPEGRWLFEIGIPGSIGGSPNYETYAAPIRVDMQGMELRDYDLGIQLGTAGNNINLGRMRLDNMVFVGKDGGTSHALRVFNRSADFICTDCQWDNNRVCGEFQSIDRVYIERPRLQIRDLIAAADRAELEAQFIIRRGHMYINGGTLNPPQSQPEDSDTQPVAWLMAQEFPDWVTGTDYKFADLVYADPGDGTKLYVCKTPHTAPALFTTDQATYWAVIDETSSGPLSVWCNINARDTLFGGEGGGYTPCIWDIAAHDENPSYPRGVTIKDCTVNTNTQCGYTVIPQVSLNSAPIVLLKQIPNKIEIEGIKGGSTYVVGADYLKGDTPPTLWMPTQNKPFQASCKGVEGTLFANYWFAANLIYPFNANWMPYELAVPELVTNGGGAGSFGACIPSNAPVVRTNNTTAVTYSIFYGMGNGHQFTLFVDDPYTTIADGAYIKLNGTASWKPGDQFSCTGATSTDTITATGHTFADGDPVVFTSLTGGSNLTAGTRYYVRDSATNTFKVAATSGGAALDLGTDISAGTVSDDQGGWISFVAVNGACWEIGRSDPA